LTSCSQFRVGRFFAQIFMVVRVPRSFIEQRDRDREKERETETETDRERETEREGVQPVAF